MKPSIRTLLICLGLALITVLVYWRVGGFGFLNYDDPEIFFKNAFVNTGLTWKSMAWGATTCFYEYWHPLMWWSHELDCQLFGLTAGPHHLVSLGIHVLNSLLVFWVFWRMTGKEWRSAVVAALFALHPLHVESVAWLAERKEILSTTFWLLSVWAYVSYAEKLKTGLGGYKVYYSLALLFYVFGLLTKPMVVTLPFVLLLLDYWPLNRMANFEFNISAEDEKPGTGHEAKGTRIVKTNSAFRLVTATSPTEQGEPTEAKTGSSLASLAWEKWPFFALTVLFCFVTWYSVKVGNNFPNILVISPAVRLTNIPVAYIRYLWKTVYPLNLAVLYPMPKYWPWWEVVGAVFILITVSWLVLVRARSARYLAFGWLTFLGVLVPTIGVVQVGAQAMADRYMYVPLIGLFAAAVWGIAELASHVRLGRIILGGASVLVLGACAGLSWVQAQYWHDSISLWKHCIAAGCESVIADHDLGRAYLDTGQFSQGVEQYQAALKLDPDGAYANLGVGAALVAAKRPREATNYIAKVLRLDPNNAGAHGDMGLALIDLGDFENAVWQINDEIELQPNLPNAYSNLGQAYSAEGKSDDAVNAYLKALEINPAYAAAYYYLGMEYLKRGAPDKATESLEKAAKFDPTTLAIHLQLSELYDAQHETAKAVSEYRVIVRLNPNVPEVLNNLAWFLATAPDASLRNGGQAVEMAEHACELTSWQQTVYIGTLAAAYAEAGDFDKAVQTAQKACDLAAAHGEKELLQKNQELLAQYQKHQPVRESN